MYNRFFANEAIDFQRKSTFAAELVQEFENLSNKKNVTTTDLQNLAVITERHTNMKIKPKTAGGLGAAMMPPALNKNNVMLKGRMHWLFDDKDARKILKTDKKFSGSVNLKDGTVYGDFTKVQATIFIGKGLLIKNGRYTPAQTAAIFLHELGHFFVYLEMIGRLTTTAFFMEAGMREILRTEDKEKRFELLVDMEDRLGGKIVDKKGLAEEKRSKEVYTTVFLNSAIRNSISQTGANVYDVRAYEQLADQYVSRQGLGKDLVIALDNLHRGGEDIKYREKNVHYMLSAINVAMNIITVSGISFVAFGTTSFLVSFIGAHLFVIYLLAVAYKSYRAANSNKSNYDKVDQRMELIKQDAIAALKNKDLEPEEVAEYLSVIETVDNCKAEIIDNEYFLDFLWNQTPWGSKETKEIEWNKDLEKMLNNDLFAAAAQLQHNRG